MSKKQVSRRDFLKKTSTGATATAAVTLTTTKCAETPPETSVDRVAIVAAIGNTLIPSDPGDPGYRVLEDHNITAEVLKQLPVTDEDLELFNDHAGEMFSKEDFLQLSESEKEQYFDAIFSGKSIDEQETNRILLSALQRIRRRVFRVYYSNYPEHALPRDADEMPILPAGDNHQITNPNTTTLVTGWDTANYMGPLTWEEEERRRAIVKEIDWKE